MNADAYEKEKKSDRQPRKPLVITEIGIRVGITVRFETAEVHFCPKPSNFLFMA